MKPTSTQSGTASPEAIIDLDAVAHNIRVLNDAAGSAAVMAVVKADAYGHGAVPVARAALAAGAAELGVATIDEALELRAGGITGPVLAWLHPPGTDFEPALRADVQIGVSALSQLERVVAAAERTGVAATVTVKADTGLNRNGVSAPLFDDLLAALASAAAAGAVRVRGLMSHLSHGDEPDHPANDAQAELFREMLSRARRAGVEFEVAHLSNSPAVLARPDLSFDMVRPGIAVYGLNPLSAPDRTVGAGSSAPGSALTPEPDGAVGAGSSAPGSALTPEPDGRALIPVMTLRAPVAMVKSLRAGAGVSYGHAWVADRDTTVALIPAGYADGVFRGLSGRIEVLVNGRRRKAVGRICMDQFMIDLGPGSVDVTEGDDAILFGPGGQGEMTAADWADLLGTIHYEVVTSPRGRVLRRYRGGGDG